MGRFSAATVVPTTAIVSAHIENRLPSRRLLNLRDAAVYLGRTEWAVRELIWKGRIPVVRIDRRIQLDVRDLDALIESAKVTETR